MSLLSRIQKLIDAKKGTLKRNFFIIGHSQQEVEDKIAEIKLYHNLEDIHITVFKLYE